MNTNPTAARTHRPYDVTAITDQLFVAAHPRAHHVAHVRSLGVDLVLSMIWVAPPHELTQPPFKLLRLPTIDSPLVPIPLFMINRGVEAALPVLESGGRVLVYCWAGRHRSVVMLSCLLIAHKGMTAEEAMDLITARRRVADPHAWYIERRIHAFERSWRERRHASAASSQEQ